MMDKGDRRTSRGFGLLEVAIALVVIGGIVASVITWGSGVHQASLVNQMYLDVVEVRERAMKVFAGMPRVPDTRDAGFVASLGVYPERLLKANGRPQHAGKRPMMIAQNNHFCNTCGDIFNIDLLEISQSQCFMLGSRDWGPNSTFIRVHSAGQSSAILMLPPYDLGVLKDECYKESATDGLVTLKLEFRR